MKSHSIKLLLLLTICCSTNGWAQDKAKSAEAYNKGLNFFKHLKYQDAEKAFTASLMADSSNVNAWIKRGFTRGVLQNFDGEFADYTYVIEH